MTEKEKQEIEKEGYYRPSTPGTGLAAGILLAVVAGVLGLCAWVVFFR